MDRMLVGYLVENEEGGRPLPPANLTVRHGGSDGGQPSEPFFIDVLGGEIIIQIEGWVGNFDGTTEIFGLVIHTNRKTSPVLGLTGPLYFNFAAQPGGHFFAFFGREGLFVDALGAYEVIP